MINHAITLSLLIAVVILLRAIFRKKVPQRLIYALWLVVIIKMCLPFAFFTLDIPSLPGFYPNAVGSITAETTAVFETEIKETSVVTNPPITQLPETLPPSVTAKPIVTAPHVSEIITAPSVTVPSVTAPSVTAPSVTAPSVTAPPEVTHPAPAEPKQNVFDLGKTLFIISLLGSVAVGAFFSLSAFQLSSKLRSDRVFLKKAGRISVYVSQNAITPCVFGIIPKIYLTPEAAGSEKLETVLCHELTHIRHGDNLWAVVRTAALVVFWWNPLVWAAAVLSKRDSELACDEAVASHLDADKRIAYAHTIVDFIPQKGGHAHGLSGAPIKERLIMLTGKRKTSVICVILALVLALSAAGCSFIGSKPQTPDDTTKPSDTTEPSYSVDPEKEPYFGTIIPNPIEFSFGEGVVEVSAFEHSGIRKTLEIDSEHVLTSSYSLDGDTHTHRNITVYIINTKTGKIVHTEKLKDGAVPASAVKTIENGVIVNSFGNINNEYTSWEIKRDGEKFTITEVPYNEDYYIEMGIPDLLTSPDGKTAVRNIGPKDYVTVKTESGEEKTVLETHLTEANIDASVKGYVAVDFIDNDRFVYKMLGWEHLFGYGIYNVKTGEKVEYENGFSPSAAYDGKVYGTLSKNYEFGDQIFILGEDGVHREITVPERYAAIFENMNDSNNPERFPVFHEGKWFVFNVPNDRVYVFSDDLSTMLAEIKLPWDRKFYDVYFSGNRMTVFFDEQIGAQLLPDDTATDPNGTTDEPVALHFGSVIPRPVEFTFGEGEVEVSAFEYSGRKTSFKIDNEHVLVSNYNYEYKDGISSWWDITLYFLNTNTGKIVQTEKLSDGAVPASVVKSIENGVVVNSYDNGNNEYTSWEITRDGEKFTVTEVPYDEDYYMEQSIPDVLTSPDGKTTVYNVGPKTSVTVKTESGEEKTVLRTHLTEPGKDLTIIGYVALGFLDNDRFVYRIGGWEWTYGYGIYNVKTGENVEYKNGFSPSSVYDGKVYSTLIEGYAFADKIGILGEDGVHREITVPERYASIFDKMAIYAGPIFHEGKWYVVNYKSESVPSSIYVFSDDLSSLLSEIKLTQDRYCPVIYFSGGRINLILGEKAEIKEEPQEDIYSVAELLYLTSGEMQEKYDDLPDGVTVSYDGSYLDEIPYNKDRFPEAIKINIARSKYESMWGNNLNSIINPNTWERVEILEDGLICAKMTLRDFTVEYTASISSLGEAGELISLQSSTVKALEMFIDYCKNNKVTVSELTIRLTEEKHSELTAQKVKSQTIDSVSHLLDMTAGEITEKYGDLKGYSHYGNYGKAVIYKIESMPGVGLNFCTERMTDTPDSGSYPVEVVIFGSYDRMFEGNVLGTSAKGEWEHVGLTDKYGIYRLSNRMGDYVLSLYCNGAVGFNVGTEEYETVLRRLENIRQNPTGRINAITVSKVTMPENINFLTDGELAEFFYSIPKAEGFFTEEEKDFSFTYKSASDMQDALDKARAEPFVSVAKLHELKVSEETDFYYVVHRKFGTDDGDVWEDKYLFFKDYVFDVSAQTMNIRFAYGAGEILKLYVYLREKENANIKTLLPAYYKDPNNYVFTYYCFFNDDRDLNTADNIIMDKITITVDRNTGAVKESAECLRQVKGR